MVKIANAVGEKNNRHTGGEEKRNPDQGGVFADKSRDGIYKPLVESADLSGAERTVWNGMVGGLVTVKSSAFRGIAAGFLNGEERSGVTVEFVCDRESGRFVYWHEMQ